LSRVGVAQFVSLQQTGCVVIDAVLDLWFRQHGFAAQNPNCEVSGRKPVSSSVATTAESARTIMVNDLAGASISDILPCRFRPPLFDAWVRRKECDS